MNLDDISYAFENPRHLSPVSAWVEHIPFAFAAAQLLRPRTFVELGTHMGDSYCAFCQAFHDLQTGTRSTAIDTWQGDPHAGGYSPRILSDLRAYHDPRYAQASTLLQSTFDAALPRFPAGTIDLLHIDGLHTYAAVKHDVSLWLPKLSDRGVLLLHDTQVFKDDFGVHRLWAELRQRHPHFEFLHGYGLGVLCVGQNLPPPFQQLLHEAQANPAAIRTLFQSLGNRIQLARGLRNLTDASRRHAVHLDSFSASLHVAPSADLFPSTPDPLDSAAADLKRWLDQCTAGIESQGDHLSRILHQLRSEFTPPAHASLALYWPNPQGDFDDLHLTAAYLPVDGKPHDLTLRIDPRLLPAPLTLRLDPGDRPALWIIDRLAITALHPHDHDGLAHLHPAPAPANPPAPPALIPRAGVHLLQGPAALDTPARQHYVFLCHTSDPRLELLLSEVQSSPDNVSPPAAVGGMPGNNPRVILELRITCRVIDSFNAYALPDRQAVAIAESLAEALHARLAATATGHPRD